MQLNVYDLNGKITKQIELPVQFNEEIRADLIKRAVLRILANKRQPYGADPRAGKRASAKISRRRRDYKTSYGYGISRSPRKILTKRGTHFYWVGAVAPYTVGGRRAHPPKVSKIWFLKLNVKERKKSIRSALAATLSKDYLKMRNHVIPKEYPFTVSSDFENVSKTKDVFNTLVKLGFSDELKRCKVRKIRSGKGKARGRRYVTKKGLLIVVSKSSSPLIKAARNIPGIDIKDIHTLNANDLAPGAHPGRMTLFTDAALNEMKKAELFM
ncbi:MAG: 50S ribosomal protein L4 [Nitrospiraceae bacterium]|nr:50S ribosomal protein L4 [Nitrospiraceae bacterium]